MLLLLVLFGSLQPARTSGSMLLQQEGGDSKDDARGSGRGVPEDSLFSLFGGSADGSSSLDDEKRPAPWASFVGSWVPLSCPLTARLR